MAVVTLVLASLGVALIVIGVTISIIDWNRKHAPTVDVTKKGKVVTEPTGLPETLTALAKLAEALKGHPLGMQLIIAGITLEVIAAFLGGIGLTVTK